MARDRRKSQHPPPAKPGEGRGEPPPPGGARAKPDQAAPGAAVPAAPPPEASSSGSIEVQFSNSRLPLSGLDALGEATDVTRAPTTEAALAAHAAVERAPVEDDPPPDPIDLSEEPVHARSSARIVAKRAEELFGQGVSKLGDGIGTIGKGVAAIGERAAKVPVLGESVKSLGEGLTEVGTSLHDLPAVTQSKSGRILVRSMLVAFLLVFAWIAAIVLLQLRDSGTPDFRPLARRILIAVRDGHESAVWSDASPRFQEVVREQQFIDDMADMKRTLGSFREIAAVNETIVTTSANGRIGRVALTLKFDKGSARANVSFHRDAGRWKLLGIAVDTPPELPITQESRKERSGFPEEVRLAAIKVLQAGNVDLAAEEAREAGSGSRASSRDAKGDAVSRAQAERDRRSQAVWEQASDVFHSSASQAEFVRLQRERHDTLGNFVRVIEYRGGSKKFGEFGATFTGLMEYQNSVVSAAVNFSRVDERAPWLLQSFKVVLPMPRPDERSAAEPASSTEERPRNGRDAGAASPSLTPSATPAGASSPKTPPSRPSTPPTPAPSPPPSGEPTTPADSDEPPAPRPASPPATSP